MKFIILLLFFSQIVFSNQNKTDYVGSGNSENILLFTGKVFVPTESESQPDVMTTKKRIWEQVKYMTGPMRLNSLPASYLKDYGTQIVSYEKVQNGFLATYTYSGKMIIKEKEISSYEIYLVLNTDTVYQKSLVNNVSACKIEGKPEMFWYYWQPWLSQCPLKEGVDYLKVSVQVKKIPNTTKTFPEYERLVQNGNLNVSVFLGISEYDSPDWDPDSLMDAISSEYFDLRKFFIDRGFSVRKLDLTELQKIYNPTPLKKYPYLEEFNLQTSKGNLRVRLHLMDTGLYHSSEAFHYFYKYALENDSVILYGGHSGVGQNLHLGNIESLRGFHIKQNYQYQILYLFSCLPYTYYTQMYFNWKKTDADKNGTKNFDILTNGAEAFFNHIAAGHITLLNALYLWMFNNQKTSYQDLAKTNFEYALFGVSGDEDNTQ